MLASEGRRSVLEHVALTDGCTYRDLEREFLGVTAMTLLKTVEELLDKGWMVGVRRGSTFEYEIADRAHLWADFQETCLGTFGAVCEPDAPQGVLVSRQAAALVLDDALTLIHAFRGVPTTAGRRRLVRLLSDDARRCAHALQDADILTYDYAVADPPLTHLGGFIRILSQNPKEEK